MKTLPHSKNNQLYCPACSRVYEPGDVHILLREKKRRILHATCVQCGLSLFLSLEANPFGLVGIGVPTDLSYTEASRRGHSDPITANTVIEIYRELQKKKKTKKSNNSLIQG